jgi:hypothetical protein
MRTQRSVATTITATLALNGKHNSLTVMNTLHIIYKTYRYRMLGSLRAGNEFHQLLRLT